MEKTILSFLKNALRPIGRCLYIYGGGWDETDTKAGDEARCAEVCPLWSEFYESHKSPDYNFRNFDIKKDPALIHMGLDCSGYVGWAIYSVLENENGKYGYVYKSTEMARRLSERGLGSFRTSAEADTYLAGDILSGEKNAHTFICLSVCGDGSLLLLHSSPPAPMLSGTFTPDGEENSVAVRLAKVFMKEVFPEHYAVFPSVSRPDSYLRSHSLFRFDEKILPDPDGCKKMSPFELLDRLSAATT